MAEFLGWIDFLDEEGVEKDGEFRLYRNPKGPDGNLTFTLDTNPEERNSPYLFDEKPVAKGVTAYFAVDFKNEPCLYNHLKHNLHFKRDELFSSYFNLRFRFDKIKNDRSPYPLSEEELMTKFIDFHLHDEEKKRHQSEVYYSSVLSANDGNVKEAIRQYSVAYIEWVRAMNEAKFKENVPENKTEPNNDWITRLIERLTTTIYHKNKTFIPTELKDDFIYILNGSHLRKNIQWEEATWKLYVLIEFFIRYGILAINEKEIPTYILQEFAFSSDQSRKKLRDSRFNMERNPGNVNAFTNFTKKLSLIYEEFTFGRG